MEVINGYHGGFQNGVNNVQLQKCSDNSISKDDFNLNMRASLNSDEATINHHTKLPHMGWNDVKPNENHPLFKGLEQQAIFYFLHSFYFKCSNEENSISKTDYGINFSSSIQHDNIYGIQFHPEKSHSYGERLLKNFANL